MGWIKITKNNKEHLVTNEMYESVFKYQGYKVVDMGKNSPPKPIQNTTQVKAQNQNQKAVKNELPKQTVGTNKVENIRKV